MAPAAVVDEASNASSPGRIDDIAIRKEEEVDAIAPALSLPHVRNRAPNQFAGVFHQQLAPLDSLCNTRHRLVHVRKLLLLRLCNSGSFK